MAGKNPRKAVDNFLRPLRKSLACVTAAQLSRTPYRDPNDVQALMLNDGAPVELLRTRGRPPVFVRIGQQYRVVEAPGAQGPWKVETVAYEYILYDLEHREVLAYHWHPAGPSMIRYPHLHIGVAAQIGLDELADAHIPTGRVALEQFLRLLIEVFGVRARDAEWRDILTVSQGRFERWRTWR